MKTIRDLFFVPSLKGEHEIKIPFLSNNNTYNLYFQRNTFEMYLYLVYKGLEFGNNYDRFFLLDFNAEGN